MTIPKIIRDTIKYLLKESWKVFLKKLVKLLYIAKSHLETAAAVQDFLQEMHIVRGLASARACLQLESLFIS